MKVPNTKHPLYCTWRGLFCRCENPNFKHYKNYGGRGISICDRWRKFENFVADMGERPPGMTLDRIDNNGNYEPGNCRWSTKAEQVRNTRRNKYILNETYEDFAARVGLPVTTVNYHMRRGQCRYPKGEEGGEKSPIKFSSGEIFSSQKEAVAWLGIGRGALLYRRKKGTKLFHPTTGEEITCYETIFPV